MFKVLKKKKIAYEKIKISKITAVSRKNKR